VIVVLAASPVVLDAFSCKLAVTFGGLVACYIHYMTIKLKKDLIFLKVFTTGH
jgi:hypothetical protein